MQVLQKKLAATETQLSQSRAEQQTLQQERDALLVKLGRAEQTTAEMETKFNSRLASLSGSEQQLQQQMQDAEEAHKSKVTSLQRFVTTDRIAIP